MPAVSRVITIQDSDSKEVYGVLIVRDSAKYTEKKISELFAKAKKERPNWCVADLIYYLLNDGCDCNWYPNPGNILV